MIKTDKILFLGNSITMCPAGIGWAGVDWGMAASAMENDYVHLLLRQFTRAAGGKQAEAMIANIAEFEKNYDTYDVAAGFKKYADFKADIVILAIGENVPEPTSQEARALYRDALKRVLTLLQEDNSPLLFIRSSFWANRTKDEILRQVCDEFGGAYVDIGHLGTVESNAASSEREFEREDVGGHPGDKGMECIAEAIWNVITAKVGDKSIQT